MKPMENTRTKILEPYSWETSNQEIAKRYNLDEQRIIRFDQNTVPATQRKLKVSLNEYPDPSYSELVSAIAKYANVETSRIAVGAGADEIIDDIFKAFIEPSDSVVIATPTYSMYRVCASIFGADVMEVRRKKDFSIDTNLLLQTAQNRKAKLMFICNPNNPDGSYILLSEIEALANKFNGIVVIDEAYFEFCGQTCAQLLKKFNNILIIRTFSKAFALAGARIGYAISSNEIIESLNKIRPPSSISTVSAMLAIDALEDLESMQAGVREITNERKRIRTELELLGFVVFPSVANFLLFRAGSKLDAERIFRKSIEQGYVIRNLSSKPGCENCLRVTIRSKQENNKLLSVFSRCPDGLLFDIDGVLIDVSKSYREAIKQTVKAICSRSISNEDIARIKQMPNSNNDWDVSYALIYGVKDLKSIDRNTTNYTKVKAKFQELYLGRLRDLETPLIKRKTLESLVTSGYCLGVVTSRPRAEASYALDKLMSNIFKPEYVVALEDCAVEKPDPKPLILAKERMNCRNAIYVGDTINDSLAAKAAGMKFVSVERELESDYAIRNVNYIQEVLK